MNIIENFYNRETYKTETSLSRKNLFYNFKLPSQDAVFLTSDGAPADLCPLAPADGGIPEPEPLAQRYRLYSRELGEGALPRLLLLHSVLASSLRVSPTRHPGLSPACAPGPMGGPAPETDGGDGNPMNQAAQSRKPPQCWPGRGSRRALKPRWVASLGRVCVRVPRVCDPWLLLTIPRGRPEADGEEAWAWGAPC